jgi:hypothetical protein
MGARGHSHGHRHMSFEDERDENDVEKEEVTLSEVEEDGVLLLMDGRRIRVSPGDIPTAVLWLPTATLEIVETEGDDVFDLSVTLHGTDQVIRACWE